MAPISQLFVNTPTIETFLGINNYASFFRPQLGEQLNVVVRLYPGGTESPLAEHRVTLAPGGSASLSVRELLGAREPPTLGLVTCEADIGTCFFFVYYLDHATQAMAMIHPGERFGQPTSGEYFPSAQVITTRGLTGLTIFQANHSRLEARSRYTLRDLATRTVRAERSALFPPLSGGLVEFDVGEIANSDALSLEIDRLPSPNGKPLIMRRYAGGLFSMSHS